MSSSNNGSKAEPKMLLRGASTTAGLSMYAAKLNPAAFLSSFSVTQQAVSADKQAILALMTFEKRRKQSAKQT